jgi:hypothetical protein
MGRLMPATSRLAIRRVQADRQCRTAGYPDRRDRTIGQND